MTIQISVLLWTVITFCILMFFLNKFLFKPLLAFMDAREQKIASARERREKAALALETAEREAEQRRRAAEKQACDAAAAAILDAKRLAAKQTAEAENKYALLGGVIGSFITITVIRSMDSLGPARATMLIVLSQLVVSYLVEVLGIFGVEKQGLEWKKLVGILIMAAGVVLFKWE